MAVARPRLLDHRLKLALAAQQLDQARPGAQGETRIFRGGAPRCTRSTGSYRCRGQSRGVPHPRQALQLARRDGGLAFPLDGAGYAEDLVLLGLQAQAAPEYTGCGMWIRLSSFAAGAVLLGRGLSVT